MGTHVRALLLAATVAVSAACGGGGSAPADEAAAGSPGVDGPASTTPTTTPTTASAEGTTLVARADGELAVSPEPGAPPSHHLPATTEFGSPRALLVLDEQGDWLHVALPDRPNGSTGWIARADVEVREFDERVEIDLAARTLTLVDGGEVVLTTPIAVGASAAPTPTGAFYVVDKLATGDPDDTYGPFAFGLSAHSDVLTEFAGGDGQVGIHGTNDPASIGQAVSHGCIRVPNDVAEALEARLHLGTPVTIG
ncbi:MAG TPA: L,D-transpeptidase [Acidimicrobiales bacterium]|nr:L,D-transpeptidase [Acidimicrobiales bacterium]